MHSTLGKMIILDIDVDLFQNGVVCGKTDNCPRPDPNFYNSDEESDVRQFLERNFNLSQNSQTKGRAFTHHVEVYNYVLSAIKEGNLKPPFTWVHVDAHDDLGENPCGLDDLNSGNYLLHLIHKDLIANLVWINHPNHTSTMLYENGHVDHMGKKVPWQMYTKSYEVNNFNFRLDKKPDQLFVVQSPAYTVESTDKLFELCSSFIA